MVTSALRGHHWTEVSGGQVRGIGMTATERVVLCQCYNFRSSYCSVSETDIGAALTTDHFQPTSRGGTREVRRNVWP